MMKNKEGNNRGDKKKKKVTELRSNVDALLSSLSSPFYTKPHVDASCEDE